VGVVATETSSLVRGWTSAGGHRRERAVGLSTRISRLGARSARDFRCAGAAEMQEEGPKKRSILRRRLQDVASRKFLLKISLGKPRTHPWRIGREFLLEPLRASNGHGGPSEVYTSRSLRFSLLEVQVFTANLRAGNRALGLPGKRAHGRIRSWQPARSRATWIEKSPRKAFRPSPSGKKNFLRPMGNGKKTPPD